MVLLSDRFVKLERVFFLVSLILVRFGGVDGERRRRINEWVWIFGKGGFFRVGGWRRFVRGDSLKGVRGRRSYIVIVYFFNSRDNY